MQYLLLILFIWSLFSRVQTFLFRSSLHKRGVFRVIDNKGTFTSQPYHAKEWSELRLTESLAASDNPIEAIPQFNVAPESLSDDSHAFTDETSGGAEDIASQATSVTEVPNLPRKKGRPKKASTPHDDTLLGDLPPKKKGRPKKPAIPSDKDESEVERIADVQPKTVHRTEGSEDAIFEAVESLPVPDEDSNISGFVDRPSVEKTLLSSLMEKVPVTSFYDKSAVLVEDNFQDLIVQDIKRQLAVKKSKQKNKANRKALAGTSMNGTVLAGLVASLASPSLDHTVVKRIEVKPFFEKVSLQKEDATDDGNADDDDEALSRLVHPLPEHVGHLPIFWARSDEKTVLSENSIDAPVHQQNKDPRGHELSIPRFDAPESLAFKIVRQSEPMTFYKKTLVTDQETSAALVSPDPEGSSVSIVPSSQSKLCSPIERVENRPIWAKNRPPRIVSLTAQRVKKQLDKRQAGEGLSKDRANSTQWVSSNIEKLDADLVGTPYYERSEPQRLELLKLGHTNSSSLPDKAKTIPWLQLTRKGFNISKVKLPQAWSKVVGPSQDSESHGGPSLSERPVSVDSSSSIGDSIEETRKPAELRSKNESKIPFSDGSVGPKLWSKSNSTRKSLSSFLIRDVDVRALSTQVIKSSPVKLKIEKVSMGRSLFEKEDHDTRDTTTPLHIDEVVELFSSLVSTETDSNQRKEEEKIPLTQDDGAAPCEVDVVHLHCSELSKSLTESDVGCPSVSLDDWSVVEKEVHMTASPPMSSLTEWSEEGFSSAIDVVDVSAQNDVAEAVFETEVSTDGLISISEGPFVPSEISASVSMDLIRAKNVASKPVSVVPLRVRKSKYAWQLENLLADEFLITSAHKYMAVPALSFYQQDPTILLTPSANENIELSVERVEVQSIYEKYKPVRSEKESDQPSKSVKERKPQTYSSKMKSTVPTPLETTRPANWTPVIEKNTPTKPIYKVKPVVKPTVVKKTPGADQLFTKSKQADDKNVKKAVVVPLYTKPTKAKPGEPIIFKDRHLLESIVPPVDPQPVTWTKRVVPIERVGANTSSFKKHGEVVHEQIHRKLLRRISPLEDSFQNSFKRSFEKDTVAQKPWKPAGAEDLFPSSFHESSADLSSSSEDITWPKVTIKKVDGAGIRHGPLWSKETIAMISKRSLPEARIYSKRIRRFRSDQNRPNEDAEPFQPMPTIIKSGAPVIAFSKTSIDSKPILPLTRAPLPPPPPPPLVSATNPELLCLFTIPRNVSVLKSQLLSLQDTYREANAKWLDEREELRKLEWREKKDRQRPTQSRDRDDDIPAASYFGARRASSSLNSGSGSSSKRSGATYKSRGSGSYDDERTKKKVARGRLNDGDDDEDDERDEESERERAAERKAASERARKEIQKRKRGLINLPESGSISVSELADLLDKKTIYLVKYLRDEAGLYLEDEDHQIENRVAARVVTFFGRKLAKSSIPVDEDDDDDDEEEDYNMPAGWASRQPIVTIMGHVDHGKTTLLDHIRQASVAAGEAGGITQAISAFSVAAGPNDERITFIDTPGHAAFSSMRKRGANLTDIVVLVVAGDDGVMEQTVECIKAAKAAGCPLVVAINKMDKPNLKIDKIKADLMKHEVVVEEFGGTTQVALISAKTGDGVNELLEMILLQAEMMNVKSQMEGRCEGIALETLMDRKKGIVLHGIVQSGVLKVGDYLLCGSAHGKIKKIINDQGDSVKEAPPAIPVQITGLSEIPEPGEKFMVVANEAAAKEVAQARTRISQTKKSAEDSSSLLSKLQSSLATETVKEQITLKVVIKADVAGSLDALQCAVESLRKSDETAECSVEVVSSSLGDITGADVQIASTCGATVIGFNVRIQTEAAYFARSKNVNVELYKVVYQLLDSLEEKLQAALTPPPPGELVGRASVLQVFDIGKVGKVAGCSVTTGKMNPLVTVRILRGSRKVIYTGSMSSLRKGKREVSSVDEGEECGIAFKDFSDMAVGDVIECYSTESERD